MNKLIKGDEVVVIAGKDKGVRGRILERVSDGLILVEGVHVVKKHTKPNPMKEMPGGIVNKTLPVHQSNVAIWNAAQAKADRVRIQVLTEEGQKPRKQRVFASTGEPISSVWSKA